MKTLYKILFVATLFLGYNCADTTSEKKESTKLEVPVSKFYPASDIENKEGWVLNEEISDEFEGTSNIRANSLNPGATQTSMRRQAYPGETPSDNPTAEEIMGAYLFLMNADSVSVNGEQLNAQINKQRNKKRKKQTLKAPTE